MQLQASGADMFFNITTPKFAAQAIRKAYDIGWKPLHYLNNVSSQVGSVLKPAGLEKSVGLISTAYLKDPTDKQWENDAGDREMALVHEEVLPRGQPDRRLQRLRLHRRDRPCIRCSSSAATI